MFRFETPPLATHDAEQFKTAFYRFLEANPPPVEEAAWLEVRMVDGGECHAAQLWSQEAVDSFKLYAGRAAADRQRPLRFRRFDDLGL